MPFYTGAESKVSLHDLEFSCMIFYGKLGVKWKVLTWLET